MIALLALALAASAPSPAEENIQLRLIPCRQAAAAAFRGDKSWLERWMISAKAAPAQKDGQRLICFIYNSGAADGLGMSKAR